MAFKRHRIEKLTNIGAAAMEDPTGSLWVYKTTDALAVVVAAGYFNEMQGKGIAIGDLIMVFDASGGPHILSFTAVAEGADATVAEITASAGGRVARGQAATVAASDTIVTGLTTLVGVVAVLNDDPVAGCQFVTANIGNQAGAPAAGSFLLKTWKSTAAGDTAQIAATTFAKKVNWIAFGT